jgi:F-type H+-transporting ATPase subunit epsilon
VALKVKIINPQAIVFEGEATFLLAPGVHGMMGIFPGHTPLYAELVTGELTVEGTEKKSFPITKGIIRVRSDVVTLLIDL